MDEEEKELSAPPRFRYKLLLIKIMTLTVLFLALFFIIGFSGLKATSSSKFCSSCHEMKPEYYTWKASTHSEVDCVNCHTDPVLKKLAKDKATGAIEDLMKNQSLNTSPTGAAPIHILKQVPNSACEKCHNMSTRQVTPSGDLIIPHDKHLKQGIECTQCHSGVAHGKIADRKMTYSTDYAKWDSDVGIATMSDLKFTRPDMDTCMECHKARNVSTDCKTCHKTGMVPSSHTDSFKQKNHGKIAEKDIGKCDTCHGYMSSEKITGLDKATAEEKILNNLKAAAPQMSAYDYAKQNTFCKNCHSKRPASHTTDWTKIHKTQASNDKQQCLACHNYQKGGKYQTKIAACASCHPSIHEDFNKVGHPIPLVPDQQITSLCYTCHVQKKCSACHKG